MFSHLRRYMTQECQFKGMNINVITHVNCNKLQSHVNVPEKCSGRGDVLRKPHLYMYRMCSHTSSPFISCTPSIPNPFPKIINNRHWHLKLFFVCISGCFYYSLTLTHSHTHSHAKRRRSPSGRAPQPALIGRRCMTPCA